MVKIKTESTQNATVTNAQIQHHLQSFSISSLEFLYAIFAICDPVKKEHHSTVAYVLGINTWSPYV